MGFSEHGGPEVLRFVSVPDPVPGPRDLVVRVRAAGVNPVDSKVRRGMRGKPPAGAPVIPGWDAAGVVEAAGPQVRSFRPSDEVFFAGDIGRPGSYAEIVAVDERIVGRKPARLSFEEAAGVPLVAITAWESLFEHLEVPEGAGGSRSSLVVGGAGGVGSFAIQLAKKLGRLRVAATASRPESADFCRKMGADLVADHSKDLAAELGSAGVRAVEYVLSCAEKNDFLALAAILAPLGRICCICRVPSADLSGLFAKRGSIHFEAMFCRPQHGIEPERQGALLSRVSELLDGGVLVPTVTRVLDWSEFREAHREIDTAHTVGKIVLRVG
ncbi:MAG: zinc-binding alcohol dehydrogenase family protein [Planctomycetes bacterium]|nr:zinc-binding alcohol dehydrogenase family protein [Planctomycetota bacterium]